MHQVSMDGHDVDSHTVRDVVDAIDDVFTRAILAETDLDEAEARMRQLVERVAYKTLRAEHPSDKAADKPADRAGHSKDDDRATSTRPRTADQQIPTARTFWHVQ